MYTNILNFINDYAPQVGIREGDKEKVRELMDGLVQDKPIRDLLGKLL